MSEIGDRFVMVGNPHGGKVRMLLPRQHDGGWPYSREMLDIVAQDEGSVLITGETGTGKELLAYYLHGQSRRSAAPFVAVNCTGLTEERMQGELFGWAHGAFTGAVSDYRGRVLEAEGGTLFLDEIAAMDPLNQSRLLRFMQTGEIEPLGKPKRRANVRVIAATNRRVQSGKDEADLIPDLFFRFRFSNLALPALRDRQADVFRFLLEADSFGPDGPFTGTTIQTLLMLAAQDWPGNIRQFKRFCDDVRSFHECEPAVAQMAIDDSTELQRLPGHVFHEIKFPRGPLQIAQALDFCLEKGESLLITEDPDWQEPNQDGEGKASRRGKTRRFVGVKIPQFVDEEPGTPPSDATKKTLALLWSLDPNNHPFLRSVFVVRNHQILPFAWLRGVLETTGDFDFRSIDRYMEQPMWLPRSWNRSKCSFADAIANLAHYCRAFTGTSDLGYFQKMENRGNDFPRVFYLSIQRLPTSLPRWEAPKTPHQPDSRINEALANLDLSKCRKHKPEIVCDVMRLSLQGKKPGEIASALKGTLRVPQIKGIIRTYRH